MTKQINNYMKHWHHIIPKHVGGTDNESNLVHLTIEEHAEAHRILFEQYGRWQDRVAWLSLAGIMKDEERIYEIVSNSNKGNPSGWKPTEEQRKIISLSKIGEKNPRYGKPATNLGVSRPGVGGRKKGTVWSEEERKTQELIRSREGYYDFTKQEERNKKISESKKGKIGNATGKTWFTDGKNETYDIQCPKGFWKGRNPNNKSNKKGLLWFNNGEINKQYKLGQEPEGFVRGKISKKQ